MLDLVLDRLPLSVILALQLPPPLLQLQVAQGPPLRLRVFLGAFVAPAGLLYPAAPLPCPVLPLAHPVDEHVALDPAVVVDPVAP